MTSEHNPFSSFTDRLTSLWELRYLVARPVNPGPPARGHGAAREEPVMAERSLRAVVDDESVRESLPDPRYRHARHVRHGPAAQVAAASASRSARLYHGAWRKGPPPTHTQAGRCRMSVRTIQRHPSARGDPGRAPRQMIHPGAYEWSSK